jgi:hypothetical protein
MKHIIIISFFNKIKIKIPRFSDSFLLPVGQAQRFMKGTHINIVLVAR